MVARVVKMNHDILLEILLQLVEALERELRMEEENIGPNHFFFW